MIKAKLFLFSLSACLFLNNITHSFLSENDKWIQSGAQAIFFEGVFDKNLPDWGKGLDLGWNEDRKNIRNPIPGYYYYKGIPGVFQKLPVPEGRFGLSLASATDVDTCLPGIERFQNIHYIDLRSADVTSEGLKNISKIGNLKVLDLAFTTINDDGLRSISSLENLEVLDLTGTKVTDEGLEFIGNLKKLKILILANTKITNASIKTIKKFNQLTLLNLNFTGISDVFFDGIQELNNLEWILMANNNLTGRCIENLLL